MPQSSAPDATCRVFTFKQGMLSALAHDLEIDVTKWSIQWSATEVVARFDASSLRVLWALRRGAPNPGALSSDNKRDIEESIAHEVLHALRYPEITFRSTKIEVTPGGFRVAGELSLSGVKRALSVLVERKGDRYVTQVPLQQPDFGIRPYSTMLGTLRLKAMIRVDVSIPAEPA